MKSQGLAPVREMAGHIFGEEQFPTNYTELREEYVKKLASDMKEDNRESLYRAISKVRPVSSGRRRLPGLPGPIHGHPHAVDY